MDENNINDENYVDVDDVEDISDVYTTDIVNNDEFINEILNAVNGSEAESSAPSVNENIEFDDSNIISSLDDIKSSITDTYDYLEHTNHRLDQTYDLVIVICFLLAGFVAISIFRKLFDWLV